MRVSGGSTPLRLWLVVCLGFLAGFPAAGGEVRKSADAIRDRYIVALDPATKDVDATARALAAKHGGRVLQVWKHALKGFWIELPAAAAVQLAAEARVRSMEGDTVIEVSGAGSQPTGSGSAAPGMEGAKGGKPVDPLWHLTYISHRMRWPVAPASDFYRYDYSNDGTLANGQRVRVYLIDYGVWEPHAEFQRDDGRSPFTGGYNAASNPRHVSLDASGTPKANQLPAAPMPADLSSPLLPCGTPTPRNDALHGTATASMLVGKTVGVAKGVEVYPITVMSCGPGYKPSGTIHTSYSTAAIVLGAIDHIVAVERARTRPRLPAVLSMSTFRWTKDENTSRADHVTAAEAAVLENALTAILDEGIPVIVSANNANGDACINTPSRMSRRSGRLDSSGRPTRVISVGGIHAPLADDAADVRKHDRRWVNDHDPASTFNPGSNFGQCVDIFAPASHIPVAYVDPAGSPVGSQYSPLHFGTSYSAPIVAGLAARILATGAVQRDVTENGVAVDVADRVWKLLEANASPFYPVHFDATSQPAEVIRDDGSSPTLRAYLGGVTFTRQLERKKIVPPGASVPLAVSVFEPDVTYAWYKGPAGDVAGSIPQTSRRCNPSSPVLPPNEFCVTATENAQYWVRVTRTDAACSGCYADSIATEIIVNANCSLPGIVSQPARRDGTGKLLSSWLTAGETSATITAKVGVFDQNLRYEWQNLMTPSAEPVSGTLLAPGGTTAPAETPLTVDVAPTAATVYRLVLCAAGQSACGSQPPSNGCWRASETIQVRPCRSLLQHEARAGTLVVNLSSGNDTGAKLQVGVLDAGGNPATFDRAAKYQWYRLNDADVYDGTWTLLTPEAIEQNQNVAWIRLDDSEQRLVRPGTYKVQVSNGCQSLESEPVLVTKEDLELYFSLVAQVTAFPGGAVATAPDRYEVPSGSRARIILGSDSLPGFLLPALSNTWTNPGGVVNEGRIATTAPITTTTTVKVTAKDLWSGFDATKQWTFVPVQPSTTCERTVSVLGSVGGQGHCGYAQPSPLVVRSNQNRIVELAANVDSDLSETFTYKWTETSGTSTNTLLEGVGLAFARIHYPVAAARTTVTVSITVSASCAAQPQTVTFDVGPLAGSAPVTACTLADKSQCEHQYECRKRRSVRSNGTAVSLLVFNPGDAVELLAPEEVLPSTYRWYQRLGTTDTQVGTAESVNLVLQTPAEYYVVTNNAEGESVSYHLVTVLNTEASPLITVTPASKTVTAGQSVTFTATFTGADANTRYEWRSGADYTRLARPILGTSASFTVKPYDNTTYWCRVIDGAGNSYNSPVVAVTVNCTNAVSGVIRAHPQRVARGERPLLVPAANGKLLVYTWSRFYSNAPTPVLESTLMNPKPVITAAETHFSATATDVCGQTGNLGTTTVYLCVPTITANPAGITVKPEDAKTLTVAATPAIDGQPLTVKWYRTTDTTLATPLGQGMVFQAPVAAGTTDSFIAAITSDCGGSPHTIKSSPAVVDVCRYPQFSVPVTQYRTGPGIPVTLVTLDSATDVTYQWYRGLTGDMSTPLTGETSGNLRIGPSVTTRYWMRATHLGLCSTNGPTMTVEVCSPPVITQNPQSANSFDGRTTTLNVGATTSTQPLTYQWQQQDASGAWVDISGATATTYTTPAFTGTASYRVRVMAGTCSTETNAATISRCTYAETVTVTDKKIGYDESTSLSLPPISPVYDKTITWYKGGYPDRTTPVKSGTGTNLTYDTPRLTALTTYWAEFTHGGCTSRTNNVKIQICKPAVTTQPASPTITAGESTTLTIATTPIAGQTYQWYAGPRGTTTTPVPNGTGLSITVAPTATTTYWCRVSGPCGLAADSEAGTVSVCNPPVIASATTTKSIRSGDSTSLSVSATASNISYQWYRGASGVTTDPIAGATYGSTQVSPATTSNYWCRITSDNFCRTDTSTMTVDVCTAPVITAHPTAQQTVYSGTPVTLSVTATSPRPMTYQWYTGASGVTTSPMTGQTAATLNVSPTSATSYWCRVTTSVCTVDSNSATVSMCAFQPAYPVSNVSATVGERVTLSLPSMTPAADKNVTWYQGAVPNRTTPVASGINATYLTPAINSTAQYWAEFTHNGCVSRTDTYTITPCKPSITAQPQATQQVPSGTSVTLSVTANGGPLTYQWYLGNPGDMTQPLSGRTASTLAVTPTANVTYWVRVTGCSTSVNSNAATITVCQPATIASATTTKYIESGQTTSISVSATGSNIAYQWYRGTKGVTTNPIAGAYGSVQVSPAATTNYWCRITTDGLCQKDTETMTVDVCTAPSITTQPAAQQSVFSGNPATLTVVASSPRAMTYQWYRGASGVTTSPISGETGPSLVVSPTADTSYWCRVTTSVCETDSNTAVVSMCAYNPTYAVSNVNAFHGERVSLSLPSMAPSLEKSITWYRGAAGDRSTPVASGTGINLTYLTPALTSTAQYWAEFSVGTCVSRTNTFTINICKPTISTQPQSTSVVSGNSTTLSVSATGSPLTYQWYLGASGDTTQPVSGQTGSTFTVTPPATSNYWVRVTGCTTSVNSATATITVCTPPAIASLIQTSTHAIGSTGRFTLTASGENLTYQWYRGESGDTSRPIAGATAAIYEFVLQTTEYYWVRVSSACSGAYTDSATKIYSVDAKITSHPADVMIPSGTSTTLQVKATGTYLTYQWVNQNYVSIPGETGPTFTTPILTAGAKYGCRVGSGTLSGSNPPLAEVTVCDGPSITGFTATNTVGTTSWKLKVTVASADVSLVQYRFYRGVPGNTSQSAYLGQNATGSMTVDVTTTGTYWARVEYVDGSCYANTGGKTIP